MAVVGAFVDVHGARATPGTSRVAPKGNGHAGHPANENGRAATAERAPGHAGSGDTEAGAADAHSTNGGSPAAPGTTAHVATPANVASGLAVAGSAVPLRTLTRVVEVRTERHLEFVDVTDSVTRCVAESGIRDGFAVVFSRHTTAGIRINEHEPLLLEDMARLLDRLAPICGTYRHDDFSVRTVNLTETERVNGHSHCRSLLLGASETVPIAAGELLLGRWQRLFLVELDGPQQREFVVQVVGG